MNAVTGSMSPERRKRLGQFFSGVPLGRLLAALANAKTADSIIDPMAGRGDLLQACLDLGADPKLLAGIEIDEFACEQAQQRLPTAALIQGNAFDPLSLDRLPARSWALVIGNPPFVRYQDAGSGSHGMPDAGAVRRQLVSSLGQFADLTEDERLLFIDKAKSYSGLADLAVPACLLSMALVKPTGVLALVLPQAWLARNYARPIRDCLDALFDVEFLVEDDSASWFSDALIKTSLLVARRRPIGDLNNQKSHLHVNVAAGAADDSSLVGRVLPHTKDPELAFAAALQLKRALPNKLVQVTSVEARASGIDADCVRPCRTDPISDRIAAELRVEPFETSTIPALGVSVGQGLRTGANEFFYVRRVEGGGAFVASETLGGAKISCPDELMRPAVRDQRGRGDAVLDLRTVALPEDLGAADSAYRVMSDLLADHVRRAAKMKSGKPGRQKPISELSAVKTNVRPSRAGLPARFWYMLPDFKPRHMPDVYLPRVCAGRPVPVRADRALLVDANFITFVCEGDLRPAGLVAILSSNWAWAWLERAGAVMGGGALKIESTMLAKLPIPRLSNDQIEELNVLGEIIQIRSRTVPAESIDQILMRKLTDNIPRVITGLKSMAEVKLLARSKTRA